MTRCLESHRSGSMTSHQISAPKTWIGCKKPPKEPSSRSVLKGVANGNEEEKRSDGSPDAPLHFEPVFLQQKRQELRYLLDQRLEQMIQFIVQRGGKFYNDELASELGVDDPQT